VNPTVKGGTVLRMEEPVPSSERDRTEEVQRLLAQLREEDLPQLTTWERQLVEELTQGLAATPIRLRELRVAVKRIHKKP